MSAPDQLYGLTPDAFIAARDDGAVAARKAGDRDLARSIKALRRPTVSAWMANQLVRQRPAEVELLLAVGAALRDAQDQLSADDIRRLARQRQQVVAALGNEARSMAAGAGVRVSAAAERELIGTLEAALADEAAGDALRQGHLTAALQYAGFSLDVRPDRLRAAPKEVGGGTVEGGPELSVGAGAGEPPVPDTVGPDVAVRPAQERQEAIDRASDAVAEARAASVRMQQLADERRRAVAELEEAHARLLKELSDMCGRIHEVEDEAAVTTDRLDSARRDAAASAGDARMAREHVEERERQLDHLRR